MHLASLSSPIPPASFTWFAQPPEVGHWNMCGNCAAIGRRRAGSSGATGTDLNGALIGPLGHADSHVTRQQQRAPNTRTNNRKRATPNAVLPPSTFYGSLTRHYRFYRVYFVLFCFVFMSVRTTKSWNDQRKSDLHRRFTKFPPTWFPWALEMNRTWFYCLSFVSWLYSFQNSNELTGNCFFF